MAAVDPTSAIVQSGAGLVQTAVGLINAAKTKKEAERLARERPDYEISPLVGQGLSLAESDLANGMSSAATKAYQDLNNQQFSASLGAILKGGGGVNSIGDIYGNSQEGRLKLAMMKDQLRLQQIQNYIKASERKQQEEQTKWQVNEFGPYHDKVQANAAARQGAQQQINSGLNAFGAGVMNYGNQVNENNQFNKLAEVYGQNPPINRGETINGVSNMPVNNQFNTGGLPPITMPSYQGWQGIPYNFNGG